MSKLPPWASHSSQLARDDPDRILGEHIGDTVTVFVGMLSHEFPNESVNRLMAHVWNLLGSRTVPLAMTQVVPSMSFMVVESPPQGEHQPLLMVPPSWIKLGVNEPTMAVAALVYCGSQAVDFHNGLLITNRSVCLARAMAYEAEFLLTLQATWPGEVLNDYQRGVLEKFPDGLPDDLRYEMKPTPTPLGEM